MNEEVTKGKFDELNRWNVPKNDFSSFKINKL